MLQSADSNRKHSAERQVRMDLRDIVLVVFDVTGARRAASHRHDSILILLAVVVMALPAYGQQLELPTTAQSHLFRAPQAQCYRGKSPGGS